MSSLLATIDGPADVKKLSLDDLGTLAQEIREIIIDTCAANGGHLAPSLGVVELTIALHRVFDSPTDRIVWDVGHQAYAHKILTGRRDRFRTLRTYGGISGFPKRKESPHDAFDVGHSSTSISAALGCAAARDLKKGSNKVVAVIGDGSMTGGVAYEGLNHAGHLNKDLLVILNDNEMSIAENVGALSNFLSRTMASDFVHTIRREVHHFLSGITAGSSVLKVARRAEESLKGLFTPSMLFGAFGFDYIGPIDGHNTEMLMQTLENVKRFEGAVLIHVLTRKGKGYQPAEQNPSQFHGVGPFDRATGKIGSGKKGGPASYTALMGETLTKLAAADERIVAITAAMPDGTGLTGFGREYPDRFFDVGIAEQHGVTFAAGLAADGLKPVFAVYSTFLQRAYDQVCHDVCLQNLPVVFAVDRAGVVGSDGPTHHGVFDLSYLRHLPNMTVMAPKDENELQHMVKTALDLNSPVAVRYPRGNGFGVPLDQSLVNLPVGKGELLREGSDGVILAVGVMVRPALDAAAQLATEGVAVAVVNARFIKPLDRELILGIARTTGRVVTVEENAVQGGFGSAVLELLEEEALTGIRVRCLGYPDQYIEQGEQSELRSAHGLDVAGIMSAFRALADGSGYRLS